jgi:spore maturation protein CgeB
MLNKVEYYLEHEAERKAIAENGYRRICEEHTLAHRVGEMVEVLKKNNWVGRISYE